MTLALTLVNCCAFKINELSCELQQATSSTRQRTHTHAVPPSQQWKCTHISTTDGLINRQEAHCASLDATPY